MLLQAHLLLSAYSLPSMTVMVFLSGGSKMAENNGAAVLTKHRDFTKTVTIQLMIKGIHNLIFICFYKLTCYYPHIACQAY